MQLVDPRAVADCSECGLFDLGSSFSRRCLGENVPTSNRRFRGPSDVQKVQFESGGEFSAGSNAAHAVAVRIEAGGVDGDAHLPGKHRQDAAADPTLGRHTHPRHPVACAVVHATGRHHRQHAFDQCGCQGALLGVGIDSVVGHRGGHHGQISRRDVDRALAEVQVHGGLRIVVDDAEGPQHVADGAIAVSGARFGSIHRVVEAQRPSCVPGIRRSDAIESFLRGAAGDERRGRDRTRVDHRVSGPLRDGVQADLVERLTRGFDVDLARDDVEAAVGQRKCIGEGLGDGLDGERHPRVADFVQVTVGGRQGDTEAVRRHGCEFGDVVGNLSRRVVPAQFVNPGQDGIDDVAHGRHCMSGVRFERIRG